MCHIYCSFITLHNIFCHYIIYFQMLLYTFIIFGLLSSVQTQLGTFFLYDNIVYPSYSSWVVTYSINFNPYHDAVNNASRTIDELSNLRSLFGSHNFQGDLQTNETDNFRERVQLMLDNEVTLARNELRSIANSLEDMSRVATLEPPSRKKRSVLPIIGDALSGLFGVSTHKQLKKVKSSLSELRNNHNQLVNVVSESLTLLNKTNVDVRINRRAIRQLNVATNTLKNELVSQYYRLHAEIQNNFVFTRTISVLESCFHSVEANLRDIFREVLALQRNLESAFKGQLTVDVLPPDKLIRVLRNIEASVPPYVKLPYEISNENLIKYYQLIEPTVLPDHYKSHIIFALPLVHLDSSYEIYHILQIPYPNENGTLGALYNVQDKYLVISPDRINYALLSLEEYNTCKHAPVCKFSSPIYSVARNPTCISSLYLKDYLLIEKYCTKSVVEFPEMPIVRHMFARHYMIATARSLSLVIDCPNERPESLVIGSVQHVVASERCSISCDYFTIPPSYYSTSHVDKEMKLVNEINLAKLVENIWTSPSLSALNPYTIKPLNLTTDLADVSTIPVSHLNKLLVDSVSSRPYSVHVQSPLKFSPALFICIIVVFALLTIPCFVLACRLTRRRHPLSTVTQKRVRFVSTDKDEPQPADVRVEPAIAKGLLAN